MTASIEKVDGVFIIRIYGSDGIADAYVVESIKYIDDEVRIGYINGEVS